MSRKERKKMIYQGEPVSEPIHEPIHETIDLSGKINAVDPLSSEGLAELVALLESQHPGIKKLNRGSTLVVNGAEISLPNTLVHFTDKQIGWTALATNKPGKSGKTSVLANNDLVGEGNLRALAQVKSVWHSGSASGEIIVKTEHLGCYYPDDQSETQLRLSGREALMFESSLNHKVYGLGETQILPGRSVYADPQTGREFRPLKAYSAQLKHGNKELFSYLLDLDSILPDEQKKPFCLELFRVLNELHETHDIIHGDVKMENIRINDKDTNNVHFYMIDFGSSLRLDDRSDLSKLTGTLGYMAPEVLQSNRVTTKSDVFAAGVMAAMFVSLGNIDCFMECREQFHELVASGESPRKSSLKSYAESLVENITKANFGEGHQEMADLVQRMLAYDSANRPDMASCYECMQEIIAPKKGNEGGRKESPNTVMDWLDDLSPATKIPSSEQQEQSSTSSSSQSSLGKRPGDDLLDKDGDSLEDSFANGGASLEVQQKKPKHEPSAVSTSQHSLFPSSGSTQVKSDSVNAGSILQR